MTAFQKQWQGDGTAGYRRNTLAGDTKCHTLNLHTSPRNYVLIFMQEDLTLLICYMFKMTQLTSRRGRDSNFKDHAPK